MTTADASAAHEVSAADGRTAPPNRASIRISASRATWASSAARLSLASASTPATRPRGMTSRASPPRSRCRTARAIAPVRSAAQASTASVTGSPASMRRSEIRSGSEGPAAQPRTAAMSMTGSDRPRCAAATAPNAWARVSTPPGAGGHPSGGVAASSPVATSLSPAVAKIAGSMPVAANRFRDRRPRVRGAQPVPDEVAEHPGAEILVAAVGEDDQPLVPAPGQQRLADGERRHARLDPHRHLVVRERARVRRPVRLGSHADHSVPVVLPACLVKQFAQDGGGGTGGHRGHSVTRHSTTTFWSGWLRRNSVSGSSTEESGCAGRPGPGAR